ncbi:fungal-specific transcription factor domain-containing protein [Scheffersomyces amazonensis]|uniref:fungal-specific transcription factor domain-containing protein n=1 Tax=Scheffersomyces amazonensis TaxID=1078765 RepID=UPI00315D542C
MLVTFSSKSKKQNINKDIVRSDSHSKINSTSTTTTTSTATSSSSPLENSSLPSSDIKSNTNRISKPTTKNNNNNVNIKKREFPIESVFDPANSPSSSINSSFKVINSSTDLFSFKNSKRSRDGCLTCKIRKKKCDEIKPICSACLRLKKECFWIDSQMSEDQIRQLKSKVIAEESNNKLRKRKSKSSSNNIYNNDIVRESISSYSPAPVPVPVHDSTNIQHPIPLSNSNSDTRQHHPMIVSTSSISSVESKSPDDLYSSVRINPSPSNYITSNNSPGNIDHLYQFETHIHDRGISITKVPPSSSNVNSPSVIPESPKLFQYNSSDLRSTISPTARHINGTTRRPSNIISTSNNNNNNNNNTNNNNTNNLLGNYALSPNSPTIKSLMNPLIQQERKIENEAKAQEHNNQHKDCSPPPLDLDSSRSPPPLSPTGFLNFIRDLSGNNHISIPNDDPSNKITLLNDENSNNNDDNENNDNDNNDNNNDDDDDNNVRDINSTTPSEFKDLIINSSNFSSVMESMGFGGMNNDTYGLSPSQSSTNLHGLSPSNYSNLISNLASILTPSPKYNPSHLPELSDASSSYLYNYYVDVLSRKISIAPVSQNDSNSYQKVFLPLAHKDKGVLYGILAWAGFYLGGSWAEEGVKYVNLALEHLSGSLDKEEKSSLIRHYHDDRQSIINKLATLLILCGAEICKGDVKYWSVYLRWGWKILSSNGGILNFNNSKEEHWLISNFAYHDLLASSSSERGTYFTSKEYDTIFLDKEGHSRGNLNPLLGVSKKLYRIIGDISTLVYETKKTLNSYYKRDSPNEFDISDSPASPTLSLDIDNDSDTSEHGKVSIMLHTIVEKAHNLEQEIDNARPTTTDLEGLTDEELELQLTLFEAFQLSAKLFLKQAIMKCNPSMLECQILNNDLLKCIDILLDSPVQASLVFPIFISGIHCVSKLDRDIMKERVENFIKLYGPWNVRRAKYLMEKVWQNNKDGNMVVDWHSILRELDWDINFA